MQFTLYVLSYNCPKQFEYWISRCTDLQHAAARKVLINNTNLPHLLAEYDRLCEQHGFEHQKFDNRGIMGGRVAAAEHFVSEAGDDWCVYFEDDYITHEPTNKLCRSGYPMYVDGWVDKALAIAIRENLHYLKLCFSEVFYDNDVQVSWFNMAHDDRRRYFPGARKAPGTVFTREGEVDGLGYLIGEVYWSTWPQVMSKEGCRFLLRSDIRGRRSRYAMAELYKLAAARTFRPAVLKATLASHDRKFDYDRNTRKL